MTLAVKAAHRFAGFALDVDFTVGQGLTALFGRSGAGKTSVVNAIAGLLRPRRGRVVLDGETLLDTASGINVAVHRRRIGYVFQDGRLFPHMTVRQNLLYGRWFARGRGAQGPQRDEIGRVVAMLGIGALLGRLPGTLSGGEKQRVAIGRALLARPRLLLMDEPLAALDEARKAEILPYVERLRDESRVPIVYVSHSVPEVARLATTIVLLSEGKVAAVGPTAEIMGRVDLFPLTGRAEAGAVLDAVVVGQVDGFDLSVLRTGAGILHVPRLDLPRGATVRVRVRARDVMLALQPPAAISALNVLPATIAEIGPQSGAAVDLRLDCGGQPLVARVTRKSVAELDLAPGRAVYAVIKAVGFDRHAIGVGNAPPAEADISL